MYSFYHALNDPNTIVVMGSSELAFNDANRVSPQNFIPDHTNFDVLSVGRGGNQSFSVFTQLLSGKDFLKNSKIVFLVSPIWFERKMSLGTPLSSFLEYNNELFLSRIISNSDNKMFVDKLSHYVEKQYYNILSPSIPLKYFYYNSISNKSAMHDFFYAPLCFLFSSLNGPHIVLHNTDIDTAKAKLTSSNQLNPINWEKKFDDARNYTNTLSTNNNLGIENETYSLTLGNGKKRQIRMRNIDDNQEFQDFQDLIKLLSYYKSDAIFVIMPLHPYSYEDLLPLKPIMDSIAKVIEEHNFPLYNQFVVNRDDFEIGLLRDRMHLGDLGWCKINNFIINNYISYK